MDGAPNPWAVPLHDQADGDGESDVFLEPRAFLSAVPDASLTSVRTYHARVARFLSVVLAVVAPSSLVALVLVEHPDPAVPLSWAGGLAVAFTLCRTLAAAPVGRRQPEAVIFLIAGVLLLGTIFGSGGHGPIHRAGELLPAFLPVIVATFVPWRPTLTLALGAFTAIVLLTSWAAGSQPVGVEERVSTLVVLTVMTALGALANQMHRRLWVRLEATRGRMVASDNLAALGRMTAGIAHEIKTPVAAILATTHTFRLLTDELRHSIGNPSVTEDDLRAIALDLDEGMNVVDTSAQKVADFVHAIREHTRSLNDVRCEAFDVRERLHEVELLLGHRIKRSHMAVEISADPGLKLRGDPGKFDQIVSNLLVNALDAADESGKGTTIRVAARSVPTGVSVSVEDDGPGVPEDIRERIFEPLYTTRLGSGGSGLGLSISRDIAVAVFGGTLTLVPRPRGAAFVLLCPHEGMPRVQRTEWAPAC